MMRTMFFALTVILSVLPACAQDPSGPQEVGTTTMPAGQYYVTEQISKKSYSLTVTQKGNMILGPAPQGVEVQVGGTAAPVPAPTVVAPAAGTTAAPGAAAAPPAAGTAPLSVTGVAGDAFKGLVKQGVQKGMQKGMTELVKQGAGTKQLKNLVK